MIIKNANVYQEDFTFNKEDIYIKDELIAHYNSREANSLESYSDEEIIDGTGLYAIPGLTDIHFHGCVGYDFCDGTNEAIDAITSYQGKNGITTICPATMTLSEEELTRIMETAKNYDYKEGAILAGINMEGPFVSEEKKGAQNAGYIKKPDQDLFHSLQEKSGNMIKIVVVAPEEEGAMEFIAGLKDEVVVSIAHTTADYDTAMEAFSQGVKQITHCYNAMPPFLHREPGVVGAAADTDNIHVELICDGVHIHPSVVRATFKFMGSEKMVLISDSMEATGMPDGRYTLGGQDVNLVGNKPTLVSDGAIAGSATNLMDCMKTAVKDMGIPLEVAIRGAAVNPAQAIGIYDNYGSITPGKVANIVLLDKDLNTKAVYIKGKRYS